MGYQLMPKEGQKNVTIPEWAWDLASNYFESHRNILATRKPPITSPTGLITHWIQEASKKFEHINTYEDHITIRNHKLGHYIDLYPKPGGELWCEFCDSMSCDHVEFALSIPEITEVLEKKGWRHKKE